MFGGLSRRPTKPGQPISVRTVERIVRRAAARAGVTKEACCRTLRRSYAVQCLRDGMDVVRLRDYLGHQHVESTLAYGRYLRPKAVDDMGVSAFRLVPLESSSFSTAVSAVQCNAP